MADTQPAVYEEFCRRPHLGTIHGGHLWKLGGRWHHCSGVDPDWHHRPRIDPDAPIAPELTVDLLIAKYEGRQEGLRAKLRGHDLGYYGRATVQAQADETNDFLTDLQRLRTTNQNGA